MVELGEVKISNELTEDQFDEMPSFSTLPFRMQWILKMTVENSAQFYNND